MNTEHTSRTMTAIYLMSTFCSAKKNKIMCAKNEDSCLSSNSNLEVYRIPMDKSGMKANEPLQKSTTGI